MPSSNSERSTRSPVGKVPYEVLLQIFVHCLPPNPFEVRQPNTRTAPMLFCHVCSFWRTVALTSPILWSHLSLCLTAREIDEELGGWAFRQNDIKFLLWWKKNQGSHPPFLRLDIDTDYEESGRVIEGDGMAFVMKYVTSAQYLEVDPIFWDRVQAIFETGEWVTFPNLHTLVTYQSNYSIDHSFYPMQVLIGRESIYTPSVLRRLAIVNDGTPYSGPISIPTHWSALTHLSMATFHISLDFWIPLTSVARCLQWMYIAFEGLFDVEENPNPIERTLPQLSAFKVVIESGGDDCLISPLFKNLHLPVLSDLFLCYHSSGQWWDHRGVTEVCSVLQSTPAIRKLTLRKYDWLSSTEKDYSTGIAAFGGVAPIWSCTPRLIHLQFELYVTHDCSDIDVAKELDAFACSAFFCDNRWLDLDNSACPIKTITVIDYSLRFRTYPPQFASNTHFEMSKVRKCAADASDIAIHLVSEPYTDFAGLWKEWRSEN